MHRLQFACKKCPAESGRVKPLKRCLCAPHKRWQGCPIQTALQSLRKYTMQRRYHSETGRMCGRDGGKGFAKKVPSQLLSASQTQAKIHTSKSRPLENPTDKLDTVTKSNTIIHSSAWCHNNSLLSVPIYCTHIKTTLRTLNVSKLIKGH